MADFKHIAQQEGFRKYASLQAYCPMIDVASIADFKHIAWR